MMYDSRNTLVIVFLTIFAGEMCHSSLAAKNSAGVGSRRTHSDRLKMTAKFSDKRPFIKMKMFRDSRPKSLREARNIAIGNAKMRPLTKLDFKNKNKTKIKNLMFDGIAFLQTQAKIQKEFGRKVSQRPNILSWPWYSQAFAAEALANFGASSSGVEKFTCVHNLQLVPATFSGQTLSCDRPEERTCDTNPQGSKYPGLICKVFGQEVCADREFHGPGENSFSCGEALKQKIIDEITYKEEVIAQFSTEEIRNEIMEMQTLCSNVNLAWRQEVYNQSSTFTEPQKRYFSKLRDSCYLLKQGIQMFLSQVPLGTVSKKCGIQDEEKNTNAKGEEDKRYISALEECGLYSDKCCANTEIVLPTMKASFNRGLSSERKLTVSPLELDFDKDKSIGSQLKLAMPKDSRQLGLSNHKSFLIVYQMKDGRKMGFVPVKKGNLVYWCYGSLRDNLFADTKVVACYTGENQLDIYLNQDDEVVNDRMEYIPMTIEPHRIEGVSQLDNLSFGSGIYDFENNRTQLTEDSHYFFVYPQTSDGELDIVVSAETVGCNDIGADARFHAGVILESACSGHSEGPGTRGNPIDSTTQ